ncbi:argininosuccinate lyase [Fastidiosibacter lacustris]|uniref:argininosuccinate lyase n=1 Tax=Fastidiosibacter lacustris TaxID=2056695 RepID=UPI000E348148|nr:argininosuccinate lyase [Fastidiosibacter lacustris]
MVEKIVDNQKQKLWGGRFSEDNNPLFVQFNASLRFDYRLLAYDIKASKVFTHGLYDISVLTQVELSALHQALDEIAKDNQQNPKLIQEAIWEGVEDVHTFVEQSLVEKLGDLAYKANTSRSRNEQVSCATRLWALDHIDQVVDLIQNLQHDLCQQAQTNIDVPLMGYTHLQQAQPITWGHYFLSFYEMLKRDIERLSDVKKRVDISPLGLGAIAGNSWQLDRYKIAKQLGFSEVSKNSLDAVSDRDYIIEFMAALSLVSVHLSRLAEDMIIYSTTEFDLLEMSDEVTTGSSLMPQKKNPDAMELVRGKTGRIYGHLIALLTTIKALPSGYNKDLQEDKEALFGAVDTIIDILRITKITIASLKIKKNKDYKHSFCVATELADYLAKKGVPFRKAHHIVGKITRFALNEGRPLKELTLTEYQRFFPNVEQDIFQVITIDFAINSKKVIGGTAVEEVKKQLDVINSSMSVDSAKVGIQYTF